jgi:hypothetical protein
MTFVPCVEGEYLRFGKVSRFGEDLERVCEIDVSQNPSAVERDQVRLSQLYLILDRFRRPRVVSERAPRSSMNNNETATVEPAADCHDAVGHGDFLFTDSRRQHSGFGRSTPT